MTRSAAFLLALLTALPQGVRADGKIENCAASARIVALAVEERGAGRDARTTVAFLTSDTAGIDQQYDQAIPALVDWVWSLDPAMLEGDVASVFEESCLAYEG